MLYGTGVPSKLLLNLLHIYVVIKCLRESQVAEGAVKNTGDKSSIF